jgi:hypothetical protein
MAASMLPTQFPLGGDSEIMSTSTDKKSKRFEEEGSSVCSSVTNNAVTKLLVV